MAASEKFSMHGGWLDGSQEHDFLDTFLRGLPLLLTLLPVQERPDAILPTMGGQTGLNLAKALSEVRGWLACVTPCILRPAPGVAFSLLPVWFRLPSDLDHMHAAPRIVVVRAREEGDRSPRVTQPVPPRV